MVGFCCDCERELNDFEIVEATWREAGFSAHQGMICIFCLSRRLKRSLTLADFADKSVNALVFLGYRIRCAEQARRSWWRRLFDTTLAISLVLFTIAVVIALLWLATGLKLK